MEKTLIGPADLSAMMTAEPVVVIDTRDPEAYAAGHIPGAVNLRDIFTFLSESTPEGLAALQQTFAEKFGAVGLSGDERAVLVEDAMNNGYGQSCRGYFLLQYLGYPKASILHGGLKAWTDAGMPLTTETPTPAPKTFPMNPNPSLLLTTQDMLDSLSEPETIKLDVRDWDEWVGMSSSPYGIDFAPRKGRIPGAVLIEWYTLMELCAGVPMFRPREEVLETAAKVGITPSSHVNLYCFKGARASNTYVALKQAGVEDVKIYFSSWNEWSRDPSLPIEEGMPDPARPAIRAA